MQVSVEYSGLTTLLFLLRVKQLQLYYKFSHPNGKSYRGIIKAYD